MTLNYAKRMDGIHKSIIREILKVASNEEIISFAGGLPNPDLFPNMELSKACKNVLEEEGAQALQYCTTEGYLPLRKWISKRYKKIYGMDISHDEILITNGSQQGLDLIGKVFIDKGDRILMEKPGYLGAIQALTVFEPKFETVSLEEDGIHIEDLKEKLNKDIGLFYTVPDFQNPSGISYSESKRKKVAELIRDTNTLLIEDNPYGELRFTEEILPPMKKYVKNQGILLGSFSKIIAPGLRIGWICADEQIMEKLVSVKQAADLHSNNLSQRIIYQYLISNEFENHLLRIRKNYRRQRDIMIKAIETYFPAEVTYTKPEGGMFLWVSLPKSMSSKKLFDQAIKHKIAFVPGTPFFADGGGDNTFRLNFSNCYENKIEEGIKRLGLIIKNYSCNYKK